MSVPPLGASVTLKLPKLLTPIHFLRPSVRNDYVPLITDWCVTLALTHLTPDTLVDLVEVALREYRIIVVDENLCVCSSAVLAFVAWLRPLSWCGGKEHTHDTTHKHLRVGR